VMIGNREKILSRHPADERLLASRCHL